MASKPWRFIPRPLFESVLYNHASHHRLHQPLIFHGPRGVGKTTLILERLLGEWNKGPHLTGCVDFAECVKDHHPQFDQSFPRYSWSNCPHPSLTDCRVKLEECLESMAYHGVKLGTTTLAGRSEESFAAIILRKQRWRLLSLMKSRCRQCGTGLCSLYLLNVMRKRSMEF